MVLKKKLAVLGLAAVMTVAFMPAMAFADAAATGSTPANTAQTTSTVKDLTQGGALTSGSYKLTTNLTTGITVASGQEVTLDLNGHSITTDSGSAIINSGTLTIQGSGSVSAPKAAVGNTPGAVCTISGGSYKSTGWYTIKNLGTMTINDNVTISGESTNSSLVDNGYYGRASNDTLGGTYYAESTYAPSNTVSLTINGGTFTGNSTTISVIKNDDYGHLTINGGSFHAEYGEVLLNWNVAKINGGTFTGTNDILNEGAVSDADACELTITGGTFQASGAVIGSDSSYLTQAGKVSISGGTFQSDIDTSTKTTSKISVSGGTFHNDVSSLTDGTTPAATVSDGSSTTYVIGLAAITKAAEDSSNTVTITQGDISLTGANAKIVNGISSASSGSVTVDGTTVKSGDSVQASAAQTIANLKSEIASLKSQLAQAQASASGAQSTANDSARQITQLKKDLADAQAQLKTAQEQAASQGNTLTAPAKVTNLKVKAGKRSAKLTWTALKDNATGYRIYRKTKGGKYAKVKTITKTSTSSWTNKGLKKGKTYYYKVRAYKSITSGELWGAYSNTVKAVAK